jgi:lysine-N-methylase
MKVMTPHYYKDFRCIAGACTDTCCAGWDVDVDKNSYKYYKTVKGAFGKRLKSVMVPSQDGECTFTLKEGGRCPFLNDDNLCDLYIELGEDKLCETCAEFPRFINDYGNIREIGIAPSCKTAGELMFSYKDELTFDTVEDNSLTPQPNDIDAYTYMQLRQARIVAFGIISDRDISIFERLMLYLNYAKRIQKHLDAERDELIAGVAKRFCGPDYREKLLDKLKSRDAVLPDELQDGDTVKSTPEVRKLYGNRLIKGLRHFFDDFKGMEVINPDWNIHVARVRQFLDGLADDSELAAVMKDYHAGSEAFAHEYEQLAMYYVYRYMLDAVNDYDVLLKAKNAVIGILAVDIMAAANRAAGQQSDFRKPDFTMRVDIAHLYSRQFEHSYYNYEVYREYFGTKRCYSYEFLMDALVSLN